jgi:nucleoside-diphosphate-sugar epimerase
MSTTDSTASTPRPVLVTGAFGLVGSALVRHLAAAGREVVATDLHVPANRAAAARLANAATVRVRWADLTDTTQVPALVADTAPSAIVHLAAMIPPFCYRRPALARAVNVEATETLLRAATAAPARPRFVQASSIAVYGPRNPHRDLGPLTVDTPLNPTDRYGAHKVEAEQHVRASALDWVILRLGGVLDVEPQLDVDPDMRYFEGTLPADGRIQTVDVRDVARAFAAATTTDHIHEVFLIGGDESHRLRQSDIRSVVPAAMGLAGGMPAGRPGDPDADERWFATDWMETDRAQQALDFQRHSFPDTLAEIRTRIGWKRLALRAVSPLAHYIMERQSPYHNAAPGYADPWAAIAARLGDPKPDRPRS